MSPLCAQGPAIDIVSPFFTTRYAITQAMIDAVQPCFDGEVDIKMLEGPVEAGPQTFEPSTMEWTDSIPE